MQIMAKPICKVTYQLKPTSSNRQSYVDLVCKIPRVSRVAALVIVSNVVPSLFPVSRMEVKACLECETQNQIFET